MKKRYTHPFIVLTLAASCLLVAGCGQQQSQDGASSQQKPAAGKSVAAAESTGEDLPKLLDLGAHACVPCKMMAPILEELTTEYRGRMEVVFIDVWQNPEAGQTYGIRSIPTQIFYDPDGTELFRHEGFYSKEDILSKWKELGYAFTMEGEGS